MQVFFCLLSLFLASNSNKWEGPFMQKTFLLIKSEGVQTGLVGKIIELFEQKGFKKIGYKFMKPDEQVLRTHYAKMKDKPFFESFIKGMLETRIVVMVWEGMDGIKVARYLLGHAKPKSRKVKIKQHIHFNETERDLIYASTSPRAAAKDIKLWFKSEELKDFNYDAQTWFYEELVETSQEDKIMYTTDWNMPIHTD